VKGVQSPHRSMSQIHRMPAKINAVLRIWG
jgi:hypothetical protein